MWGRYAIHGWCGCVISWKGFYYSLLIFTGSMEFNREMRTIAKAKCYKFSEYGLYDENDKKKVKIKVNSEEIYMKSLLPEER